MTKCRDNLLRCKHLLIGAMLLVALLTCAEVAHAGLLAPPPIEFGADELEKSLSDQPLGRSSSSSSGHSDSPLPSNDSDEHSPGPLGLLSSHLPAGGTSSNSSSSSTGGVGGNLAVWSLNNALTLLDDTRVGWLAEACSVALPDPPGTNLFRPPCAA